MRSFPFSLPVAVAPSGEGHNAATSLTVSSTNRLLNLSALCPPRSTSAASARERGGRASGRSEVTPREQHHLAVEPAHSTPRLQPATASRTSPHDLQSSFPSPYQSHSLLRDRGTMPQRHSPFAAPTSPSAPPAQRA